MVYCRSTVEMSYHRLSQVLHKKRIYSANMQMKNCITSLERNGNLNQEVPPHTTKIAEIKKADNTKVGEDVEQLNFSYTAVGWGG